MEGVTWNAHPSNSPARTTMLELPQSRGGLQPFQRVDRSLVLHVAGVQRAFGLEQDHVDLVGERLRAVLDAARNDDELTRPHLAITVAQLHAQPPADPQDQLALP